MEKEREKEFNKKNNTDDPFDTGDGGPKKVMKITEEEKISMTLESKERVFKQLLFEAQAKIHERITQKFNI